MPLSKAVAAIAMLAIAACSPSGQSATSEPSQAASAAAVHSESGLRVIPLTVVSSNGTHRFRVEVAATQAEQAKGLMFRTKMGADEGMLFPHEKPHKTAFWMRNTVIPLDIIFIGADRRILNIAANAVPYDETPLPSAGITAGVLELNGGRAAELGIKPGDKVSW